LTVDDDGATPLTVDRATSDGTIIDVQKDGTTVGSIGSLSSSGISLSNPQSNSYIAFHANNQSTGIFFQDGTLKNFAPYTARTGEFDLGNNISLWKDLYLSGGVYLGGTGSANYLDGYEEGTYDVTFSGDSGTPFTRTSAGRYLKIGRLVFINFYAYAGSSPTVPSGACYASLPFAADTSPILYSYFSQGYSGGLNLVTIGVSSNHRWQINSSTQAVSYSGNWASNPSYYELSGTGCYMSAS